MVKPGGKAGLPAMPEGGSGYSGCFICGMTPDDIFSLIKTEGYTYEHAVRIATNLYRRKITSVAMMKDLPGKLRHLLGSHHGSGIINLLNSETSSDRSVKYLFSGSNNELFEAVYLPEAKRTTVCVSSQSGCRMGCPFCQTGRNGFSGNLTSTDILNQVLAMPFPETVTHVVFMGMGEPLDNLRPVLKACRILTAQWGFALSPAHITVSTVGITQAVIEFLGNSDCNLTLSLYSPFSNERAEIIPAERKNPASEIIEIMKNAKPERKRRLSIAYLMLKGINDSDRHLEALKDMLRGTSIRVNLLPYHGSGNDSYRTSDEARMNLFRHSLVIAGISASIRKSRGEDISAACGLLAGKMQ